VDLDRWAPVLRRRTVDAGHWLPLTAPEQLAALIAEFFDAVRIGTIPCVGRAGPTAAVSVR
jgi:hypothetical protein